MYNYIISADPQPDSYTWRRNGQIISNSNRITVTANNITISSVNKSDSGVYTIFSSNVAGSGSANFTLNVYCECLSLVMYTCVIYVVFLTFRFSCTW